MASKNYNYVPEDPRPPKEPIPIRAPRRSTRWKKILGWTAGVLVLLLVVTLIGMAFLLRSATFHDYVLKKVEAQATDALNTPVHLQNFVLRLSNLTLDLYGLSVEGTGPGAGRPLLLVDHVNFNVNVTSFLRRQWYVNNITVDHPVVKVMVTKSGENNLPTPKQGNSKSNSNVFDLGVRHALLDRGEIYYNDQKNPLYADLHDLRLQATFDYTDNGRYYGTLGYRDGHLKYGTYEPLQHDLQAEFDARRSGLQLSNVLMRTAPMVVKLNASVQNYSNPIAHAAYDITLYGDEVRRLLANSSIPSGEIAINGTADYASDPSKPLLNAMAIDGQISSRELLVHTPQLRTTIRDVGAHFQARNGNAEIRDLHARLLGGEIVANATLRDLTTKRQGHVIANLRNISLADLKTITNSASLKQVVITGGVNARAEADWSGTMQDLVARTDATINSSIAPAQSNTASAVPLNGVVHARYAAASQTIALNQSYLRTPQTSVDLNGTVSKRSALQVRVQANDLRELETVANLFNTPKPGQPAPQPLGLAGKASFNGTVTGSTTAPRFAGHVEGSNLQVRNSAFKVLRADVAATPSEASFKNGDLEPAGYGRVTFNLQTGLNNWSYTPESPIVANINASQLSLAELAKAANSTTPVSGTLNANLALHGSQRNPIGQGNITLTNANISGEPIQAANVKFQGTGDQVQANLLVRINAGTATGNVTYNPKTEGYDALVNATNIQLAQIQAVRERNMGIAGTLSLTASGRGTLKDPAGQASLTIPQLTVQNQQIRDISLQASVANHEATFNLGSQVLDTPLRAQGKVALTGDYYADARLDTPVISLKPLLVAYAPAQAADISGQTEIHATVRGPLKNKQLLEAHLNIPSLDVKYQQVQIGAVRPIRADYVNGVLNVEPGEIKGTGTDLRFQGRVPLTSKAPSSITLVGTVDLALAHMFSPDIDSSGQMQIDINAAGRTIAQDVQGQIRIVNANFSSADAPLGLSEGNGVLTLRSDRVDVTSFTGKMGGGTVTATGGVVYRPAVQFDLALKGNGVRLLYPDGLRTDLGMNLAMSGSTDSALLRGTVDINRISFTPDFDLMSFTNQFSGESSPPPTQGFADNLKLNINVRTTSEVNAYSRNVSIQGDANLRVIGTAADPVIVGRTNLSGGELFLLGNRYIVQGGTIAFVNSTRTEPILNIQVGTTIQQYNIAMRFQGPIDRLHTNYTSDPALPPSDIINLIAFGKTQEAQAAQAQPGNLGAESVLASGVSGQLTSRVEKVAGISHLSVDPVLGGSGNQSPGARVTIQQRVTSKLFVTFATDVTQTQNEEIQLEYHANRKWSVSGNRDQNGGFGVDGRYHKDF